MRKIMMKSKVLALFLAMGMTLSGCGAKQVAPAPVLDEPIGDIVFTCPVERGNVGRYSSLMGSVVPKTTAQYWKSPAAVSEIFVSEGDYVKEGQIIATVDREYSLKALENARANLALENELYSYNGALADVQLRKNELIKQQLSADSEDTTEKKEEVTTEKQEEASTEKKEDVTTEKKEEASTEKKEEVTTEKKEEASTEKKEDVTTEKQEETSTEKKEDVTTEKKEEASTEKKEDVTTEKMEETSTETSGEKTTEDKENPSEESSGSEGEEGEEPVGPTVEDVEKGSSILREGVRYEELLHNFRVRRLEKEIQELTEIVEKGLLTSTASGYVCYVKSLMDGNIATAYEPVVTIADYNDVYIELHKVDQENYDRIYAGFKSVTATWAGKEYPVEKYTPTPEEIVYSERTGARIPVRMRFSDPSVKAESGNSIFVTFRNSREENVLRVMTDCVFSDVQSSYVYVIKDGKKEIRRVETGARDNWYVEILSGLEEGEDVFYEADNTIPKQYDVMEVKKEDFSATKDSSAFQQEVYKKYSITAKAEGVAGNVENAKDREVKKDEILLTIDVGGGEALLADIRNSISKMKSDYSKNSEDIGKAIEENDKMIDMLIARAETEEDVSKLEDIRLQLQILECGNEELRIQRSIAEISFNHTIRQLNEQYDKLYEVNDGSGLIDVKIERDGFLTGMTIQNGNIVKEGDKIGQVGVLQKNVVYLKSSEVLYLNQKVSIYQKDGTTYKGHIVGYDPKGYYAIMDDTGVFDEKEKGTFRYSSGDYPDTIVIPLTAVFSEEKKGANPGAIKNEPLYYVWKIMDDKIVKQYVEVVEEKIALSGDQSVNSLMYCVMSGLSDGDRIVVRKEK